jgi:2-polyprenyl-3-methyl-5-hydroxy-6-metoxy-1,4-benzoquinol methylase
MRTTMSKDVAMFELPHAVKLAEAKQEFLHRFFADLVRQYELKNALDVGCSFGYFAGSLKDLGLRLSAFGVGPENGEEAKRRNPGVKV